MSPRGALRTNLRKPYGVHGATPQGALSENLRNSFGLPEVNPKVPSAKAFKYHLVSFQVPHENLRNPHGFLEVPQVAPPRT